MTSGYAGVGKAVTATTAKSTIRKLPVKSGQKMPGLTAHGEVVLATGWSAARICSVRVCVTSAGADCTCGTVKLNVAVVVPPPAKVGTMVLCWNIPGTVGTSS